MGRGLLLWLIGIPIPIILSFGFSAGCTDDDLEIVKGKRNELSGRLQQRYGYAKDHAEREIDTWLRNTV